jgi:hypothetical protein
LDAFNSWLSLFNNTEQIEINYQNKSAFMFLSAQCDNSFLKNIC